MFDKYKFCLIYFGRKSILIFLLLSVAVQIVYCFNPQQNFSFSTFNNQLYRPLGGYEEKEQAIYPAGPNSISSPATSGRTGSISCGIGMGIVTLKNLDMDMLMLPLSVTLGINKFIDAGISAPYTYNIIAHYPDMKGFGDAAASFNYHFLSEEDFGIGAGFGLNLNMPTSVKELSYSENKLDISGIAKIEKRIVNTVFTFNYTYTYTDLGKIKFPHTVGLAASIAQGFNEKISGSVEFNIPDIKAPKGQRMRIVYAGFRLALLSNAGISLLYGINAGSGDLKNIGVMSMSFSY